MPVSDTTTAADETVVNDLRELGIATRTGRLPGADIASGRLAHRTNLVSELRDGLIGDYDWFEGDVSMVDGVVVMRHDAGKPVELTLAAWLSVVVPSGRGMKFDVKDRAALLPIAAAVAAIFSARDPAVCPPVIMNGAIGHGSTTVDVTTDDLRAIRAALPGAIIAITVSREPYLAARLTAAIDIVAGIEGPIAFVLVAVFTTRRVVERLKPYGAVCIWNSPHNYAPANIGRATRHFRKIGVNGMIDLRPGERWPAIVMTPMIHAWIHLIDVLLLLSRGHMQRKLRQR
ncbi:MAG: DUF2181 domain-containing protein [Thermoleophilia bacterium]|nr:DUF2181 domain-containing protein [Thermoleophilia bacterium]